jgi:DNA polymerase-4
MHRSNNATIRRFTANLSSSAAAAIAASWPLRVMKRAYSAFQAISREIFALFREFTPLVEGLSLDEAFLDVTASRKLFGSGRDIAVAVKERIRDRTRLTASVGVAANKLVAKIASDLDKPDGLVVITAANLHEKLDPLPVAVIPGIGKETRTRLSRIGVYTIADLRRAADHDLEPIFGRFTGKTRDRAAGIDDRAVVPSRAEKSISAEETYDTDLADRGDMERQLLRLAERTSARLRKSRLAAGTVQVKIRQSDFRTFTRQKSLQPPGNGTDQIFELARALLRSWLAKNPGARIRLLGVGGSKLAPAGQDDLFAGQDAAPGSEVDRTVDEIRDRFGNTAVSRARTLDSP